MKLTFLGLLGIGGDRSDIGDVNINDVLEIEAHGVIRSIAQKGACDVTEAVGSLVLWDGNIARHFQHDVRTVLFSVDASKDALEFVAI